MTGFILYHKRPDLVYGNEMRVYSPEEYAQMGYVTRDDYNPSMFTEGSYQTPNQFDINFLDLPVYRAESKEDYYVDFTYSAFKLTGALFTGGAPAVVSMGVKQLTSLLN